MTGWLILAGFSGFGLGATVALAIVRWAIKAKIDRHLQDRAPMIMCGVKFNPIGRMWEP